MRSIESIHALAQSRKADDGPLLRRMREVADHYHDDVVMPLAELDASEKYAIPNLVAQGIDQYAARAASVMPDMVWPATNPGSQKSVDRAQKRRQAAFGWWENSAMPLLQRQRCRWLTGYGSGPVQIVPDLTERAKRRGTYGIPLWQPRNPMTALPSPRIRPFDVSVDDCIFSYTRPHKWLRVNYGIRFPASNRGDFMPDDMRIEVLEYLDADEWVLIAVGPATDTNWAAAYSGVGKTILSLTGNNSPRGGITLIELERVANRLGVCPVSLPGRVGLERIAGQMDGILGMRVLQARLMALEINAVERAIFPNEWAVFSEASGGQVVKLADGRKGIVGEVRGGQVLVTNVNPGVQTYNTMNYLERSQRLSGQIPAELGGESQTNVRTGRRGEQLLSNVIEPALAETHQLMAHAMTWENELAVATIKAYAGNRTFSVHVSWTGAKGVKGGITYTPNQLFETDENTVSYAQAGADSNSLVVGIGQRVGIGELSLATSRQIDPFIDDPEEEGRRVTLEGIERAVLTSLEQQAASGALPIDDLVFIAHEIKVGHADVIAAVQAAQQRAQQRQASAGPPGTPTGPAAPGSPEAQPGLAAGTPGAAGAVPPTVPDVPQGQANAVQVLRALATVRSQGAA